MIDLDGVVYEHPGGVRALAGIDLHLDAACWTALIGANGSGKTTLARCLNGLLLPTAGRVRVGDIVVGSDTLALVRRRVAMVFQNPDDQLVAPTVETDLAFGLENHGVDPAQMRRRVDEVLERFGLEARRHHPPHVLSGGERQRLAVAAAVAVRPDFLVLDEPTALLDPTARAALLDLIGGLRAEGLGVLHITQSPDEAARADRLLVLHRGQLCLDAPPRRVFARGAELADRGLAVPFATQVGDAAGSDTLLSLSELSQWLADHRRPPSADGHRVTPPGATTEPLLRTEALSHVYRTGLPEPVTALDRVSTGIAAGSIGALVGASGSGKTTLVQHLNGLLRPTSGHVRLHGEDIWADGEAVAARRRVGLVFQFPEAQLFEETVAADVAFGPRCHGLATDAARRAAEEALRAVGLPAEEFGHRGPLTLSGGERRRAAIAGVLAIRPEVLILDEPTAGLDPANERLIATLLRRLADEGHAVWLVSHDIDRVAELCATTTVLQSGRVLHDGPTPTVLEAAADEVTPPAALQLTRDLRRRGWRETPTLLTRAEACHFVADLAPRDGSAPPTNPRWKG